VFLWAPTLTNPHATAMMMYWRGSLSPRYLRRHGLIIEHPSPLFAHPIF